ncbi:MAG: sodium:proton antiporter [Anaerolineae bacterium]
MINLITALAVGFLFAVGVFLMLRRDLIKAAMGFSVLFNAVNLVILAVGAFRGNVAPFTTNFQEGRTPSDPLVQALILTAIVVSFGSYALLLGMVNLISRRFHTVDSDEVVNLKR